VALTEVGTIDRRIGQGQQYYTAQIARRLALVQLPAMVL